MSVIERGRPGARPAPRRKRWPLLLLAALVAAGAAYWWRHARERVVEPAPPPTEVPAEPAPFGASQPAPAPAPPPATAAPAAPPAEPLPPLAESDALARTLASGVSRSPLLVHLLDEAGLIERFVAWVDQLADGRAPRRDLAALRPSGRFLVLGKEPELRVDPDSYHRYDALAQAIVSVDAAAAVAAYRRVAPLCEESYRALGYPEGGFEQRLRAALALLLATPQTDASPALVAQVQRYEFADPHLESLADAQKQLLRMGPKNAERVLAKLREIDAALGARR